MPKSRDEESYPFFCFFLLHDLCENPFQVVDGVYKGVPMGEKCSTQCAKHYRGWWDPDHDEWLTVSGLNH